MRLCINRRPRDAYGDTGVGLVLGVGEPCVHRAFVTSAFIEYLLGEVMALYWHNLTLSSAALKEVYTVYR